MRSITPKFYDPAKGCFQFVTIRAIATQARSQSHFLRGGGNKGIFGEQRTSLGGRCL